ncbi:MAG TPA: putative lipid II flippase FtsW [Oligoflexia bacterium]|nr:putative lipid II flippase FtsW [Oligoflexia bacterium]HMR24524.1 putative lipid II flippase FtsW [Oligoflexia bacterium]
MASRVTKHISNRLSSMDYVLLISIMSLVSLGTIMIYSASSLLAAEKYGSSAFFLSRHIFVLLLTLILMPAVYFIKIHWLKKTATLMLLVAIIGLILTVFTDLGVTMNYAKRWLNLGFMRIQVSEFLKPILVIYLASYLSRKKDKLHSFSDGLLPLLIILGLIVVLMMKQPDFGSTAVIVASCGLMMFVGGVRLSYLFTLLVLGLGGAAVLIASAQYRLDRFTTFLNPWNDPSGKGFQILQSLVAFQRGGVYGQGLGDGSQKLLYLPEAHTDFIFSVVGEELGLIGSLLLIFFFVCFVVQGLKLSIKLKDDFARYMAFGLTALIGLEAVLNMSVVMALLPTKGLTLPFISYGRSSLLASLFCATLLLSLSSSVGLIQRNAKKVSV